MSSLKQQTLHGVSWSFTERFGQMGLQFIITVILARLLAPRDFGVLGMIMMFVALAQSVIDSGFGTALIQRQNTTQADESTVFWFNLLTGLGMAGVLFAAAPWIAAFYDTPLLKSITRVFSLTLVINSFGIVQNALLTKELAFKSRMLAGMAGLVVSGAVSLWMAWNGFGVWSLVAQGLVMNAVRTAGMWVVHPWRPALTFSRDSFREFWSFGSKMLCSGLLTTFFDNIYLVVIGKLFNATQLGFYQNSKKIMIISAEAFTSVVSQVNLPLFSKMQSDTERLRRAFARVLTMTMFIVLPMMAGICAAAPGLIRLLLGEKWMPCVPYLQIMSIFSAFFPFHLFNLNVILALGRSDIHLRLEVIKKIVISVAILATYRYGIFGLLWGQVVTATLFLFLNAFYVKRFLKYGLAAQLASIWKIVVAALGMMAVIWAIGVHVNTNFLLTLGLQGLAGGVVYAGVIWALKEPSLVELTDFILEKWCGKKRL
jgi:O-antigen/teichoic acid export membrane protein